MEKRNGLKIVIGIAGALILLFLCFVFINKSTYSIEPETIEAGVGVSVNCTSREIDDNGNVKCDLFVDSNNNDISYLSFVYDLLQGKESLSFEPMENCTENCFKEIINTENVFLAGIPNGGSINEEMQIGYLVINFNEAVNDEHRIELKNIKLIDKDLSAIFLSNSKMVYFMKQPATLENIDLGIEGIDFNFEPSKYSDYDIIYVDANVSSLNVSVSKFNTSDIVSGDVGQVNLHYGTNELKILVDSRDGTSQGEYTIKVNRRYNFTDKYYNYYVKNDVEYLYTRSDVDDSEIFSNIVLEEGLSASYDENKLIVSYGEEVIKSINVINFSMGYSLVNDNIYLKDTVTNSQFISDSVRNGVIFKFYDVDGNELGSDIKINSDYKLKVYDELSPANLLATYTFKIGYLSFDDDLVIDDDNKIIKRLSAGITYGELKKKIHTSSLISLISHDDSNLNDDSIIRTGDKLSLKINNENYTYTISVLGDLTGDGKVIINDVTALYRLESKNGELDLISIASGDIINDGYIKINDVTSLYRTVINAVNLEE